MTLQKLIELAKEREISITGLAFELWDYLDNNVQRALARELCSLYNDNDEHLLLENLEEYYPELMLPREVKISLEELEAKHEELHGRKLSEEALDDFLGDYLSDKYGYCHFGFDYDIDFKNDIIICKNIEWDIY